MPIENGGPRAVQPAAPMRAAAQATPAAAPATRPAAPAPRPKMAADQAPKAPPATQGVPDHWLGWLPSPLRWAGVAAAGAAGHGLRWLKDKLGMAAEEPAPAKTPQGRAAQAWGSIERKYGVPGTPGLFTEGTETAKPATVWPHGQAVAAALDLAEVTGDWAPVDRTMAALDAYDHHGAYAPGIITWNAKRLWDDNAWIGLDFMQAYGQTGNEAYLAKAESLFPFMKEGLHKDGGVYWEERNARMTRNTCANAPAIAFALKLYEATGKPEYKAYAENCYQFMTKHMRGPDGLYYDNLGDDGKLDKAIYSYNQGAAIGAEVMMYKVTGDPKHLENAKRTADAAMAYFGQDDRLWKSSPAFNAIYFRNLLVLDTVAPDPRYRDTLRKYVDRVWQEGRDPATGALTQGGIGSYDGHGLLDESGFVQMNALLAWAKPRLKLVA